MNVYSRAQLIIECGKASTTNRTALSYLDSIQLHTSGYAESGYSDPPSGVIATGNWNSVTKWNEAEHSLDTVDETLPRVAKILEQIGVELEWCDEWITCEECYKLVRTNPDSYGWTRSYWQDDYMILCCDCVKADPSAYLESLEGNPRSADTIGIDLEENGYICLQSDFENGFHAGQDADPKVIAKSLKEIGIKRFIFTIDSVGQFDMEFSVWIAKDELDSLTPEKLAEWARLPKDGPSVSDGLRRALQSVSNQPHAGDGIQVTKLDVSTGTSETRIVSPQDFIDGKAMK